MAGHRTRGGWRLPGTRWGGGQPGTAAAIRHLRRGEDFIAARPRSRGSLAASAPLRWPRRRARAGTRAPVPRGRLRSARCACSRGGNPFRGAGAGSGSQGCASGSLPRGQPSSAGAPGVPAVRPGADASLPSEGKREGPWGNAPTSGFLTWVDSQLAPEGRRVGERRREPSAGQSRRSPRRAHEWKRRADPKTRIPPRATKCRRESLENSSSPTRLPLGKRARIGAHGLGKAVPSAGAARAPLHSRCERGGCFGD